MQGYHISSYNNDNDCRCTRPMEPWEEGIFRATKVLVRSFTLLQLCMISPVAKLLHAVESGVKIGFAYAVSFCSLPVHFMPTFLMFWCPNNDNEERQDRTCRICRVVFQPACSGWASPSFHQLSHPCCSQSQSKNALISHQLGWNLKLWHR